MTTGSGDAVAEASRKKLPLLLLEAAGETPVMIERILLWRSQSHAVVVRINDGEEGCRQSGDMRFLTVLSMPWPFAALIPPSVVCWPRARRSDWQAESGRLDIFCVRLVRFRAGTPDRVGLASSVADCSGEPGSYAVCLTA